MNDPIVDWLQATGILLVRDPEATEELLGGLTPAELVDAIHHHEEHGASEAFEITLFRELNWWFSSIAELDLRPEHDALARRFHERGYVRRASERDLSRLAHCFAFADVCWPGDVDE